MTLLSLYPDHGNPETLTKRRIGVPESPREPSFGAFELDHVSFLLVAEPKNVCA